MMTAPGANPLETRLTELAMSALAPCDLGDGIEVVHDVEVVEVEMECTLDDAPAVDEPSTHPFARVSAPYERIEIQLDANAYIQATIAEAQRRR
jgi:hypothetical protein